MARQLNLDLLEARGRCIHTPAHAAASEESMRVHFEDRDDYTEEQVREARLLMHDWRSECTGTKRNPELHNPDCPINQRLTANAS